MVGIKHTKKGVKNKYCPHGPKYTRDHDKLIIKILGEGGTLADFCTHPEVMTGRQTVYGWYARFPTFKEAYDLARELSKSHYEKVIKSNLIVEKDAETTFDMSTYIKTAGVRFSDMRTERPAADIIDDADLMQSVKNLANAAAQNLINQEQVRNISTLLQQAVQIKEQEQIVERIERLESADEDDKEPDAIEAGKD